MSVDILGTDCDQCECMVQCCFTFTETVRLIRTGRGAQDGHLDSHTAPELCHPLDDDDDDDDVELTIQLYCLCVEKFAFWLIMSVDMSSDVS